MTNAEKYLKDNVSVEELADKLTKKIQSTEKYGFYDNFVNDILIKFFKAKDIPTLTEDERVILRNIDETVFTHIGRDTKSSIYDLYLRGERTRCVEIDDILKPDLFTFIKERRRI